MPGIFNKAPLVYVTASLHTTGLPGFEAEQIKLLRTAMLKLGYSDFVVSNIKTINMEKLSSGSDIQSALGIASRYGFFDVSRTKCIVIEENRIEYRSARYGKYKDFVKNFDQALEAAISALPDLLPNAGVKECALSYSDVIAPYPNRNLKDYFKSRETILPLSFLSSKTESDFAQAGTIQATRLINQKLKIDIFLEQIISQGGRLPKFIPNVIVEPDPAFSMNLGMMLEEWNNRVGDYGLLLTRASKLSEKELKQFNMLDEFSELHKLTSDTFFELIEMEVCREDWEYHDPK